MTSSIAHPVVDRQATGRSNHKSDIWTGLLPTSTHCCGRAGARRVPPSTPTEIGGASGGASTAIVAVMNLETRHEAPHFEEQPCSCPEKVATTRREAEPTQG